MHCPSPESLAVIWVNVPDFACYGRIKASGHQMSRFTNISRVLSATMGHRAERENWHPSYRHLMRIWFEQAWTLIPSATVLHLLLKRDKPGIDRERVIVGHGHDSPPGPGVEVAVNCVA